METSERNRFLARTQYERLKKQAELSGEPEPALPPELAEESSASQKKNPVSEEKKQRKPSAKKQKEEKEIATAPLMMYLPENLKRDLKLYAIRSGKTMSTVVREILEEKIYGK